MTTPTTVVIPVFVTVCTPIGDEVDAGAYLDAALAYMTEVADDQHRITTYRIEAPRDAHPLIIPDPVLGGPPFTGS